MASKRAVLITGATGKQGGAVVDALLSSATPDAFQIYALTRKTSSPAATALQAKRNVKLVQGDLDNPSAIFGSIAEPVWGVFAMTAHGKNELQQGQQLVEAAAAHGVSHFVFSSIDRGGAGRSDSNPTPVPHFIVKHQIEQRVRAVAEASGGKLTWTFVRPVAFFENLTPDAIGRVFAAMWAQMGTKKLHLISTRDVGWFGAQALLDPDTYRGRAVSIAGDELDQAQADAIFAEYTGKPMPNAPGFVARFVKWALADELGKMFAWFVQDGYGASVAETRELHPDVQDFRTWLAKSSKFRK